jgi:hypothetical protein
VNESNTINLGGGPLTIRCIHEIICHLCIHGQVSVQNCHVNGPGHAATLLNLMHGRLSAEDKEWLRSMVQAEIANAASLRPAPMQKPGVLT